MNEAAVKSLESVTTKKSVKKLVGVVVRCAVQQKTIKVHVLSLKSHPKYRKVIKTVFKATVHDPEQLARLGNRVAIRACKPVSRTKSWELESILS